MKKYTLKDKDRYAALVKALDNFEESLNESCNVQINDGSGYGIVKNTYGRWELNIKNDEIEIKEVLKPYIWYNREEFDGNPNNYILIEKDARGDLDISKDICLVKGISVDAIEFMYIER